MPSGGIGKYGPQNIFRWRRECGSETRSPSTWIVWEITCLEEHLNKYEVHGETDISPNRGETDL